MTECRKWMRIVVLVVAVALMLLPGVAAAGSEDAGDGAGRNSFEDRAFVLRYPRTVPVYDFQISIDHRAFAALDDNPGRDLLGLDSGNLRIGLGVTYGLLDGVDVGVTRYNGTTEPFDVYEFIARWQVLSEQEDSFDLTLSAAASMFDETDRSDEYAGSGSVVAGKTWAGRVYSTVGALYHGDSHGPEKLTEDDSHSLAVLATLGLALSPSVSLVTEWSIPVEGYEGDAAAWAVGPKFLTEGHTFSLTVSNTQNISLDGLAAGSDRWSDPVIGFTITRQL